MRQVVRPDKVQTDYPHAPETAPAASLVCVGFKDGSEVRQVSSWRHLHVLNPVSHKWSGMSVDRNVWSL